MLIVLFTISILIGDSANAQAAYEANNDHHKIGFVTGYGNQSSLDVTYNYQIAFIQFEYIKTLTTKNTWSLEMIAQPQVNLTSYDVFETDGPNKNGFELGINNGFVVRKTNHAENLDLYFIISSGPLYVPNTPARQSAGLNFSSSLNLGMLVRLSDQIQFDLRPGVRHLSNAALRRPNRGINNVYVVSGLSFNL